MKIAVKAGDFSSFLNGVMSKGIVAVGKNAAEESLLQSAVLVVKKDYIDVKGRDIDEVVLVHKRFYGSVGVPAGTTGEIVLNDLAMAIKILNNEFDKADIACIEQPYNGAERAGVYNNDKSTEVDFASASKGDLPTHINDMNEKGTPMIDDIDYFEAEPLYGPFKSRGHFKIDSTKLDGIDVDAKDIAKKGEIDVMIAGDTLEISFKKPHGKVNIKRSIPIEWSSAPVLYAGSFAKGFSAAARMKGQLDCFTYDSGEMLIRDASNTSAYCMQPVADNGGGGDSVPSTDA
jgi:hypothetical protein